MNKFVRRAFLVGLVCLYGACFEVRALQAPPPASTPPARQAQRGGAVIQGTVKDDTGGVIPGATVTLSDTSGTVQNVSSGADGSYRFRGIRPGTYTVTASYTGLQVTKPVSVTVALGQPATGNIVMTVQEQKQEITVTETTTNQVSTEASNNASALVLKQEDLDALPDDPDDLQADLEALAGPSAGPGGSQIFIDGFTGGRLPPKESIREIRINSNPFSAEFDKLGFSRIQIFTKPGSDKFHGQGYYNISDDIWNSRNPFLTTSPPFRTQLFGGNLSGPLSKRASFFVDIERRNIDDNGIITAFIPTADFLNSYSYQNYFPTPQRRTTVSPRLDYQLGANNTLSFRYSFLENDRQVTHIGSFNLPQTQIGGITFPSNGYGQSSTEHSFQVVETAVLSTHVVNETHFEFERDNQTTTSSSGDAELNVGQSFVSGGSGYSSIANAVNPKYGSSYDTQSYYELQNYTTATWGAHTTKFGVRIRTTTLEDLTPTGFNGEYSFLGNNNGLTSIQQFNMTELLLQQGRTPAQILAAGYGPSKFTINTGNPYLSFYQLDVGPFVQDEWRVRPNLTLSLGVRWEAQNNINDKNDWAPRFGFAWSPGARGANSRPKTVIRGGWGIFYDRFTVTNVEQAYRSNSVQQYTISNPLFYNQAFSAAGIPPLSALTLGGASQNYIIDQNLKAPRLMQTAIGLDRQLFSRTTLSLNFINSRGTHELLTDDINAPFPIGNLPPGVFTTNLNALARPFPGQGDIYDFQSVGVFKQTQAMVNVTSQVGRWFTLFSRYGYAQAHSDTDGLTSMPANPYNIAEDWGRSSLDVHHTAFVGGSVMAPWGLRFSPFMVFRSGTPFNITTGTDLFGVGSSAPTARPEPIVGPNCVFTTGDLSPALKSCFNTTPLIGAPLIERNYATGPGSVGINLRVSKTFGFGTTKFSGPSGGARAEGGGGGFGGGGGRRGGGFGGFGGGGGRGMGGESTEHRYNLTISVMARNIINHENLNTPNGALTSRYFAESTGISGGYGPEAGGGGAGGSVSNQRRIDLQLRFAF